MPELTPPDGITLIEAQRAARAANMHLIHDGKRVKVSPIIPPGWRKVITKVKITAPDRGTVQLEAA